MQTIEGTDRRALVRLFARRGLAYPAPLLLLRLFKQERLLELWAGVRGEPLQLIRSYPVCASSGRPGPKRRAGDLQVPEGFYRIDLLNPASSFHRSMRVSYPNRSDRLLGDERNLGGWIMIHGGCATVGCIPIENRPAEQLYNIVRDSRRAHRRWATVHIFPARMIERKMPDLIALARGDVELLAFWSQLRQGFAFFERSRRIPRFRIDRQGAYHLIRPAPAPAPR